MKPSFRQQLDRLAVRLQELDAALTDPKVAARHAALPGLVARAGRGRRAGGKRWQRFQQCETDLAGALSLLDDPDMAEMAKEEMRDRPRPKWRRWTPNCRPPCCPRTPTTRAMPSWRSAPAPAATNPRLFAGDLARMYTRFAERRGWKVEILSASESDLGGYKEVVLRLEGHPGLWPAQVRIGGPPRATRARHRIARAHPHQRLHRGRDARGRRGRGRDAQPGRPAHRHLPCQWCGRPAHQQDRLGRAHHPPAHRAGGRMPGRPLSAPQQGQGHGGAGRPPARQGPLGARRQGGRHTQGPDRQRRPQRPDPHLQLPPGPAHRPPHQPHPLQARHGDGRRPRRHPQGA